MYFGNYSAWLGWGWVTVSRYMKQSRGIVLILSRDIALPFNTPLPCDTSEQICRLSISRDRCRIDLYVDEMIFFF